ncbi:MAG: glycosyltransferase family 4 protein [Candidatus Levybacteria bacterium]|nr:glycosyltransferase family 4 protein [Candidatus Levybacteria bacterium]
MNVLLITSTFPHGPHDNQVPWLSLLLRQLKEKGVNPVVYAPSYRGSVSHTYHSIPVVRFRYAPKFLEILTHGEGAVFKLRQKPWLFIVSFLYLFFGIIEIMRMHRKYKFDVVHVHWPFPQGLFGIIAKKLFHAKLVLTFHGAEFSLMRRLPFGTAILKTILRNSDKVVANSSFTKKLIQEIEPIDVSIIPFSSAVIVDKIKEKEKHFSDKKYKILFIGRLIERKGVSFLVDAVKILRRKNIPVLLDIVGNGPLHGAIKDHVDRLGLNDYIKLHQGVNEENLSKFYKNCDVFVLPAIIDKWGDTEGLGVVLIEAMSFGKPVVASNVGGISNVVKNNENGFLVEEKNPQALAGALQTLFDQPTLSRKFGVNGLSYVKKCYNWKNIIDKTIALYRT